MRICSAHHTVPLFALLPSPAAENGTTIHDGDSVPMNNWTDQSIDDRGFTLSPFDEANEHLSPFNSRGRGERPFINTDIQVA